MKVFISFATSDQALAEKVYEGLTAAGAEVYEFRRSARPGTSAWNALLKWISDSDVFVTLVSRNSLKSNAVAAEIDHAHYEHVNKGRPYRLIPVQLESGIDPPNLLRRFSTYELGDPTIGIPSLVAEVMSESVPTQSLETGTLPAEVRGTIGSHEADVGVVASKPSETLLAWADAILGNLPRAEGSRQQAPSALPALDKYDRPPTPAELAASKESELARATKPAPPTSTHSLLTLQEPGIPDPHIPPDIPHDLEYKRGLSHVRVRALIVKGGVLAGLFFRRAPLPVQVVMFALLFGGVVAFGVVVARQLSPLPVPTPLPPVVPTTQVTDTPSPQLPDDMRPTVAVYPAIHGTAATDPGRNGLDSQELTRRLEEALGSTRLFRLFERDQEAQKAIFEEQDLAKSDRARGNAAEFGKLYNVALIVQPFISEFRFGASFSEVAGLPGMYSRIDSGRLVVVFRVLDTTSGEIKDQHTAEAGFASKAKVLQEKTGGPGPELWIQLVDEVSRKGADAISSSWPIKVVVYENDQLFLNRGEGAGLKIGDDYTLFATGESLIDPDTQRPLGRTELPIGKVKVVRIGPMYSVAERIGELKKVPKKGDILRKN
jgi:hypothetical protein